MKHYECENQNHLHIFTGDSIEELLQAIAEWWPTVPHETSKILNTITFSESPENQDGTFVAHVSWSHLDPYQEREVEATLTTPQALDTKPDISTN